MQLDPIVEEMRQYGQAFAKRHKNDLAAMCKALREKEVQSGRPVVSRPARRLPARAAG